MTVKRRRRKLTKKRAKEFLATPQGQEWLQRKIAQKHRERPDPGPMPERFTRTQFPLVTWIISALEGMRSHRGAYSALQVDYE